jgi:hypothetical protein
VEPESAAEVFQLEITRFGDGPATEEYEIETVEELDARLGDLAAEPQLALGLCYVFEEADEGSFWLFLNGDRAYIHLVDGPCYTAWDPSVEGPAETVITFQDDAGFPHHIPLRKTTAREQGLRALRLWMQGGEKLADLTWELDRAEEDQG